MFDRPGSGERAILVCVGLGRAPEPDRVEEFGALARSAGAQVLEVMAPTRKAADPRFFIGTGKVNELRERIKALGADLVVIDGTLSPSQERNLEKELQCRVLDRSGLILDIFAQRARTFEGKLQGQIDSFDQFVVLLRNSVSQMVYKHAISTVVPARNVRLPAGEDDLPPLEDAPTG